ncbi:glycosyltransferase [Fructobacillus sp. M2-14]|uniref:Glycosyltransferase n=1 Tax=Fructobacillus broussonetiae TaxID=2713173 RepID=A0ABS5QZ73_9LACO|nr:glycosyltransferase [Fructobacillus broussonetiae]MBS9338460.1 glycosyltransferase [Fructobacillus broussonetiae]
MNIFLNNGLYDSNSGVEHAQFYRLRALKEAGEPVKLVYSALLPKLHEHMKLFDLEEEQVINLFEWAMADDPVSYLRTGLTGKTIQPYKKDILKDFTQTNRTVVEVATGGYTITRRKEKVYNEAKKLYIVSDAQVELSRGDRKLSWSYDRFLGEKVMTAIHLENFFGSDYYFQTFDELLAFFMGALERAFGPATYFLDRDRSFDEYLVKRQKQGAKNKLVSIIHASHRVEKVEGRQIYNQFYQFVLEHAPYYDKIVVATARQAADLKKDIAGAFDTKTAERVVSKVPVGFVDENEGTTREITAADKVGTADGANDRNALRLVTASRLHEEKHVDQLVNAVDRLKQEGLSVHLTIFGRGPQKEDLQKQVADAGLQDAVTFAGVSNDLENDLAEEGAYNAYVSASYSEGFGLTYLEALHAGLPVLTYANEYGAKELIDSGKNGYLIDFSTEETNEARERNVSGMVEAVQKAVENLPAMCKEARKSVARYDLKHVSADWKDLLNDVKKGDNHANSVD